MNFDSTVTKQSESQPGITFTVRVLNRIQRAKRDLTIVDARVKITDLSSKLEALRGHDDAELPEADRLRRASLDHEIGLLIDLHLKPAYIRAGLLSIEGLEIDGSPATAESLIISSSTQLDGLIDEIFLACATESGLSEDQKKASSSPTTSSEASPMEEKITIANAA